MYLQRRKKNWVVRNIAFLKGYRISVREMWLLGIIALAVLINMEASILRSTPGFPKSINDIKYNEDKFRTLTISSDCLEYYIEKGNRYNMDYISWITIAMVRNNYDLSDVTKETAAVKKNEFNNQIRETKVYDQLYTNYASIFMDLVYFPIPVDLSGGETVRFSNSWMGERSYGGTRGHEGTDIMTSNNTRGYYPVLSITQGRVEQKGWLEKGGYRIGIRGPSGAYFYYAHLHSYANGLEIGDEVKAGELLGFMGDTGYSKVEGTTGNFDVHLHLGIYLNTSEGEISINPYWILKYLEKHKLEYYY